MGRSDTLFVAMLDTQKNRISLLSVPRDTLVKIPGHGWDKVNHAYAFGGHALSQKTLEGFWVFPSTTIFGGFRGFVDLVNAIGGVDIDVEKPMQYQDPYDDNGGLVINLQPGRQHMDGTTAIQYVRYRDEEGYWPGTPAAEVYAGHFCQAAGHQSGDQGSGNCPSPVQKCGNGSVRRGSAVPPGNLYQERVGYLPAGNGHGPGESGLPG